MNDRKLPNAWRAYNTYDYVPVEEWSVGDDIELFSIHWDGTPHSASGFDTDWTIYINAKARCGGTNAERDVCLLLQVTSCEKDAFRVRFSPSSAAVTDYPDKVYGPIVADRLSHIRRHEQAAGYRPILRWNRNGVNIQLRAIQIQFVRAEDGLLSIRVKRLSDGAITDISSGPLFHAAPGVGTVANMKRQAESATHYFGLGELLNYNLTGRHHPETGAAKETCYGYRGYSRLDHSGEQVTCYNYDNLWYNQPEVFPRSIPYQQAFKASSGVPQYLNAPFYIERAAINGRQQFLGVFLDNTGQSYFSFKNAARDKSAVEAGVQQGEFDCHYMFAHQAAGVLDAFTYLMGRGDLDAESPHGQTLNDRAIMPPKYIFGYFQAKYGFPGLLRPQGENDPLKVYVEDIVAGHRQAAIPIEGLGIDIDIQEDKKVFTIKDSFWSGGKVGAGISVFDWAAQFNLQCQTNITPFIRADKVAYHPDDKTKKQYETAQGLIQNGYCVQNEGEANIPKFRGPRNESDYPGLTYTRIGEINYPDQNVLVLDYGINAQTAERDMIGAVVTDYGNPDAARFWGDQYAYLLKNGLGFVWQDMTVPDAMPHVEDGENFADTEAPRNQFGWSLTGKAPDDDRRRTNTFNWRGYHGQLHLTDPRFGDGRKTPFVALRNFHAYMLAKSSYEYGLAAHEDLLKGYKRSYIICRSGYPGLQHYAGHWVGDNASTWHHLQATLPMLLNLGMSGLPIAGTDVGGFAPGEAPEDPGSVLFNGDRNRNHNPMVYDRLVLGADDIDIGAICEQELMARWVQAACLLPWMRNHYDAMKPYQEIYRYTATAQGERTFSDIMAAFIRFRVRWHHLLYDAMYQNTQSGAPVVKAMSLWEGDEAVFSEDNRAILATQFFIDNSVIVAPILTRSMAGASAAYTVEKAIYLPAAGRGRTTHWFRYNVLEDTADIEHPVAGGKQVKITADITELPLFIREGAIIPERHTQSDLQAPFKNIQVLDKFQQPLVLSLYPLENATESDYQLYWDDGGVTRSAERGGVFSVIDIHQEHTGSAGAEDVRVISLVPRKYDYPLHEFIYLRIRSSRASARRIVIGSSNVAERLASTDKLFLHQGEAAHIDNRGSIWVKARTNRLSVDKPLIVSITA
ncbi:TIM-barrel domain-containing protein [Brenneria populi]|uniref:TIM-barrel domain-containing protein n=1 Tax=Brenneria populi TaxID=1505588 RepID=A0ABU6JTS4_9GAMM|nr:TIM-barrel domain-containing protein [Brenneria populi Li et al. 2015]